MFEMIENENILDLVYTSDQIGDDLPKFWDHIDLEAMASGHVHYEDEEPDEVKTLWIH